MSYPEKHGHLTKENGRKKRGGVEKFPSAELITGQEHVTEADLLQRYYGLAARRNQGNLKEMRKAVWVMFCHKL